MIFQTEEVLETFRMIKDEHLDVRTVTMGMSLLDCADPNPKRMCAKIRAKIKKRAGKLCAKAKMRPVALAT